ncbi:glycoside hydrolase family 130 protein [bacterium]|nr:glycoside hydrolase family 130 protein [bacterium]
MTIAVERNSVRFYPNPQRVITRFFLPGNKDRAKIIIKRITALKEEDARNQLQQVLASFATRHRNITEIFTNHFKQIFIHDVGIVPDDLSYERKLLIGAYFTMEYSIESAAFFNPSIIEDPNQENLNDGEKRVIVSFRAVGEGHISSIVFRSGIIKANGGMNFAAVSRRMVDVPITVQRHEYNKEIFMKKLGEMKIPEELADAVMDKLDDDFIYGELQASIVECEKNEDLSEQDMRILQTINWVANSHYTIKFSLDTSIEERVIFPVSYTESKGIEDARFVRFVDDDGSITYYATYTAYNGFSILPKLIQTTDFYNFKVMPMHGHNVQNKGMALFPRKINGQYVMISRLDGVNSYIMYSNDIHLWDNAEKLQEPKYPWEFIQVGNNGSPLETKVGWLVLTHGVGPMREYSLGAILLDLENPTKVIGRLKEPLLTPNEEEREGYVPNVVYSCGALIHNNKLVIPYAMSDFCSTIATVPLDDLLAELLNNN